ncbi:MAG: hypothetical protein ACI8X5_000941 [Planctomycetota bacterium]|jgi:hypothetical protein
MGTKFSVLLPRVAAPAQVIPRRRTENTEGKGACILVVDDETSVRRVFGDMLDQAGYEVLMAADGEEPIRCSKSAGLRSTVCYSTSPGPSWMGRKIS